MIGFNGGLIGKTRPTVAALSIPGVWTSREQEVAVREARWSGVSILDLYPGATAAYSLRNLRAAVANSPVVKVRRSSGSPSTADFTATEVADGTLTAWVGAGNDGFVHTWYDQSTSANNAVQATDASQPRIVNAGALEKDPAVGGKPAIVFGAATNVSLAPAAPITTASACAFFFVTRHVNSAGTWSWIVGENSGQASFFIGKQSGTSVANVERFGNLAGTNIAQKAVSYWQLGTGITRYQINSQAATLSDWTVSSAWRIGIRQSNSTEGWVGPIQEVIYFPSNQVSNSSAIITNLNLYYGIF